MNKIFLFFAGIGHASVLAPTQEEAIALLRTLEENKHTAAIIYDLDHYPNEVTIKVIEWDASPQVLTHHND
ncbi:MAG: hypothetical protein NTX72_04010 [Candidatus Uhrbacteria bacterium]|nr:hypothetical protein [Candidatus Uhrbacteria bacterium]